MTKPTTPEQEFAAFMSGDADLSRLYQQTSTEGPSELADKRILDAAHKDITKHHGTSSRGKRWLVPAAIAAGLVILSLVVVMQYQHIETDRPGREMVSNLKPDPTHLLDEINGLAKEGNVSAAQDQYRAFIELHPDFPIDYQRYPELLQFKENK